MISKNSLNLENINQYLNHQSKVDVLRFITCGSVDDGKSTLIGRMLYEAQILFDDQIASIKKESIKYGTQGNNIDFALLVDGLEAEREQGITIDVAYRYFSTDNRKFIVADTPGHEQYTRNMVTGSSTADLAIILVDARKGILSQTKRHSIICSIIGIRNIVLAINKMDLVNYSKEVFYKINNEYLSFAKELNFETITAIPISALNGDNIVNSSEYTKWFQGPKLIGYLETIDTKSHLTESPLRLPLQWINRPNSNFRGFAGKIESGIVKRGEKIRILPSGEKAEIKDIYISKDSINQAQAGQSVTITLDREVDASRGDVISSFETPCEISDHFETNLFWLSQQNGFVGRSYLLKIGTNVINAKITRIKYKIDINNLEKLPVYEIQLNDLLIVHIKIDRPVPFEKYQDCRGLGGFILIDRYENKTIAAGMINFSLRRANNIHIHKTEINKIARQELNGHKSFLLWFTGISGSGKSTIANELEKKLHSQGIRTYILDGDNVRHGLNNDLGFTKADRIENIRRIIEVSKLMVDAGIVVISSFISPFKDERNLARSQFEKGEFFEVFIKTPLEVAEKRDPKGLYKKARKGELLNFTGIDSPYEEPENPEIIIDTVNFNVNENVSTILKEIKT